MTEKDNKFSYSDGISLQEFFEKILAEKERALLIATTEISRRLALLNGEAERLRNMQATYLPREVAEAAFQRINDKFDLIFNEIAELKEFRAELEGKASISDLRFTQVLGVISILIALAGIVISVLK